MMRKKIGELLVDVGAVSADDVRMALGNQKTWGAGQRLGQVLVAMGKATQKQVARALSTQFDVPFVELPQIPASVSQLVPVEFQSEHGLVPFRLEIEGKIERLHVAVADPSNLEPVDELRFQLGKPMRIFVAAKDDIDEVLAALRGDSVAEVDALEIEEDATEMVVERGTEQVPQGWFATPPGADPFEAPPKSAPAAASRPGPPVLEAAGPVKAAPRPAPSGAPVLQPAFPSSPRAVPAAPTPPPPSEPPIASLPPEWDIFEDTPASPPSRPSSPAAPPSAQSSATSMASTADLDDLLGSVTAAAPPSPGTQPLTRPALPPPPMTKAATVVKFEPPPRTTPSSGTPALTAVPNPPAVPPGATTSAAPPSNLTPPTPLHAVQPPATPAQPVAPGPKPSSSDAELPIVAQSQIDISEEDLKILENIERMALGDEPTMESAKVKPAQMVASLIRLLMKKGVIGEAEFLEELGRK